MSVFILHSHSLTQSRIHKITLTSRVRTHTRTDTAPRPLPPTQILAICINVITGKVGSWLSKRIGTFEDKARELGLHESAVRRSLPYKKTATTLSNVAARCLSEPSISTHFAVLLAIDCAFTKHQNQGRLKCENAILSFKQLYAGLDLPCCARIDNELRALFRHACKIMVKSLPCPAHTAVHLGPMVRRRICIVSTCTHRSLMCYQLAHPSFAYSFAKYNIQNRCVPPSSKDFCKSGVP